MGPDVNVTFIAVLDNFEVESNHNKMHPTIVLTELIRQHGLIIYILVIQFSPMYRNLVFYGSKIYSLNIKI